MFPDRFMSHVNVAAGGCWVWLASKTRDGYGQYHIGSRADGTRRTVLAHRYAYEHLHGKLSPKGHPDHKQVDHACHNRSRACLGGKECAHRRCVNPAHLIAVTAYANTEASEHTQAHQNRRKTHCSNGHEFTPANTYTRNRPGGGRQCKTCQIANRTRRRREMAAAR